MALTYTDRTIGKLRLPLPPGDMKSSVVIGVNPG